MRCIKGEDRGASSLIYRNKAAGGYPGGYYGDYANRSYVTVRPTLFPGRPTLFSRYWGW